MKLIVFGLTISSSWGNGHATLWRGLCSALGNRGHQVIFYERDVPYYAATRDYSQIAGCQLRLYSTWDDARNSAAGELVDADVAMVTSYCPDGVTASRFVLDSSATTKVFYDLDTPVTLQKVRDHEAVDYLPPEGLQGFDLVLSYTGGLSLTELQRTLGARRVAPLYGSVDPEAHRPVPASSKCTADLSYLGTYAADRQEGVERLFIQPARLLPHCRFLIGGAQYPQEFPWTNNIFFLRHIPPADHPTFYCSSRLTLNVTRKAMAKTGFCPSGRLFEAAACGVPIVTDGWEGLEEFYEPGEEVIVCRDTGDVLEAIQLPDRRLEEIASAARRRTLASHTANKRVIELENLLEGVSC